MEPARGIGNPMEGCVCARVHVCSWQRSRQRPALAVPQDRAERKGQQEAGRPARRLRSREQRTVRSPASLTPDYGPDVPEHLPRDKKHHFVRLM